MRFWCACVFLLVCLVLSSVSAGGGRRRKDRKGGRIKELQKRVDELKVQVEKLRECVNTGKQKIRDLTDKLAKLEKLCSNCVCRDTAGKCYPLGGTYDDDCNTCSCGKDGNLACTEKACVTTTTPEPTPPPCPTICTKEYAPVCGSNRKTYANICLLRIEMCKVCGASQMQDGCEALKKQHDGSCLMLG